MDVSIIIVNYKTSHLIIECIKSIIEHTLDINYEIIVVDNNSEPDFAGIIFNSLNHAFSFSGENEFIHFVTLSENIGFGRANNEGLRIAKGRNILFLNPDTLLLNNAVKILSDFLDCHSKVGACGGNLIDKDFKPTFSFKRFLPGVFWEFDELLNTIPQKILYGRNKWYNYTGRPFKVGFISGADLMVKKSVLEQTGGFRDDFFLYFEETDLCNRIREKGWEIYNVPSVSIQHLEGGSLTESTSYQSEFKTKYMELSRKIYYRLNVKWYKKGVANYIYYIFLKSRVVLLKGQKRELYIQRLNYMKEK